MPLYRYSSTGLEAIGRTTLANERIRERDDLQRVLRNSINILGDDLLVVAEEYALFQDSRRRVDLLAIDRSGTLVVIELKRTDDGGHMELQALRYAAMVSTMTPEHLVAAFSHYNGVEAPQASQMLLEWVDNPDAIAQLSNRVRIILLSADFSTEITSTVLWLNANYGTDIRCYRLTPYKLGDEVVLDIQQIVPLPEAADFQVQQRLKGAATAATKAANEGRDYTKYDLRIGDRVWTQLSKQTAIRTAVQQLREAGIGLAKIRSATAPQRWVAVHPSGDESVIDAFRRENPDRQATHLWFDLGITEGKDTWVFPRFGGLDTEPMLAKLAEIAKPEVVLTWSASDGPITVTGDADLTPSALMTPSEGH